MFVFGYLRLLKLYVPGKIFWIIQQNLLVIFKEEFGSLNKFFVTITKSFSDCVMSDFQQS